MKKITAFSMIELSIVILIIGILVAGVTQSSRLVRQFRLQTARNLTLNAPITSIPNLAFWIESTQEGSFLENEAQDGVAVTKWNDINRTSIERATISVLGTAPVYRQSAINGLPAIQFSGNGCYTINHVGITNNGLKTFFAVFLETGKNSASGTYLYDNLVLPPQFAFILPTNQTGQIYAGAPLNGGSIPLNKPHLVTIVHNVANSFFRVNGVQTSTANPGSNVMNSATRLGGGGCTTVGDTFFGYIAEFVIFDRVLKADEYMDIEKYLSAKWGIKI
ncbi:hypothetical protein LBMAG18_10650 [Alphaproteobacteria bacterium]|nr:hypothetical protein LBMAG18_10650 [Alphaproteobacteria bacterium]